MAQLVTVYDDSIGSFVTKDISPVSGWNDEFFTAGASQATFELDASIDASTKIEAWINDRQKWEDDDVSPTRDWSRDTVTDDIIFNSDVPEGATVVIRIWS